jgi:hypothetical protein
MREGKELTMPIAQRFKSGKYLAQAGRHRISYCVTLGLGIDVFVTDWEDIEAANPEGLK